MVSPSAKTEIPRVDASGSPGKAIDVERGVKMQELQRKWKGGSQAPFGVAILITVVVISGFGVGIRGLPNWYQIVLLICHLSAVSFLYLTFNVDPGVILPNPSPDPLIKRLEDDDPTIKNRQFYMQNWRGQWVRKRPDGSIERYCITCHIWRPPRASHCNVCGYCMERFDHHCQVLGCCVAKYNHRFFVAFLFSAQIGCVIMCVGAAIRLYDLGFPGSEAWAQPETIFLLILNILYAYLTILLLFSVGHCFSIVCDVTTKDLLSERDGDTLDIPCTGSRSPGNLFKAWGRICCAPVRLKFGVDKRVRAKAKAVNEERERRRQEKGKEPQTPMDSPSVTSTSSASPAEFETPTSGTPKAAFPVSTEDLLPVSTSVTPSSPDVTPVKTPASRMDITPISAYDDKPVSSPAVPERLRQLQDPPSADEAEARQEEQQEEMHQVDKEEDEEEKQVDKEEEAEEEKQVDKEEAR